MPERTSYAPGTPSWVDLGSPDVETSIRFYGGLFGWDTEAPGSDEETGGYRFFLRHGKKIAGVGPLMGDDQPPAWSTYFATDDADALAAKAQAAGGAVVVEPMSIMDAGRMLFVAHPAAGVFGAWEAGRHIGAEVVNEPGALTWNELLTRDVGSAKAFLNELFGLSYEDNDMGDMTYTTLKVGDDVVGGLLEMPPTVPDEVPSFWQCYFAVEDADATLDRAQELGGSVAMPATEIPEVGRFASIADPHGAVFSVIRSAAPAA